MDLSWSIVDRTHSCFFRRHTRRLEVLICVPHQAGKVGVSKCCVSHRRAVLRCLTWKCPVNVPLPRCQEVGTAPDGWI